MNICYELTPADTLFFRGSEPMEAGQLSRDAIFPPPVTVIQGALRSALLRQRQIFFADYNNGRVTEDVIRLIGQSGEKAPFAVTALLFRKNGITYVPCPACWFVEDEHRQNGGRLSFTGRRIFRAAPPAAAASTLRLHSSSGSDLPMIRRDTEVESLAGYWLRLECLQTPPTELEVDDLCLPSDLYDLEPRTGIELDSKRKVKQGRLYSSGHIRLRQGVTFLVGLDKDPGLTESGLISLGGEKRQCGYIKVESPTLPQEPSSLYLAMAPVELTEDVLPSIFSAAKPVSLAGWDMHTGFHKPTTTWLPAGTVFHRNINNHCMPLSQ